MKNRITIAILLVVVIILSIRLITTNKYDVNRDGVVNSKDLLDLKKYLINKGDDK